jgi:hypothetical protein
MKRPSLIFYPQMRKVVDHYIASPHYRGESLLPIAEFEQGRRLPGPVVVLARGGHYHHYDLDHIRALRERGQIPSAGGTTLVLFDWHEDLDHDPRGTQLGNGTWAYLGLERGAYANAYVIGVNPRGWNELNSVLWEEDEIHPTTEETLRLLDRVCLFPLVAAHYCLKLFPECEPYLAENESVDQYFAVSEGRFVVVRFKGADEVSYRARKAGLVVSIDLDVLRRSEVKADCPQGAMSVDGLLGHLDRLRRTGPVNTILVCGLTESPESQDDVSLESVARILSLSSEIVGAEEA